MNAIFAIRAEREAETCNHTTMCGDCIQPSDK
jgi:hypothetical protein